MDYTRLGTTNLKVSRLGFGCSQIASLSTRYPGSEVRATLQAALDAGLNFFDTADIYGQGDSERLLGRLFSNHRDKVVYCTKAGLTLSTSQLAIRVVKPIANPLLRKWKSARTSALAKRRDLERHCFEPDYLKSRIIGSLKRLRTDYLDLFLLHSPPRVVLERGEALALLADLKRQGVIRHYGVSCATAQDAMFCLERVPCACLQVSINPLQIQADVSIPLSAKQKGVGLIAREPFAGGERLHSKKPAGRDGEPPALASAASLLRHLLGQPGIDSVLVGMSCRQHLEENLKAISAGG